MLKENVQIGLNKRLIIHAYKTKAYIDKVGMNGSLKKL